MEVGVVADIIGDALIRALDGKRRRMGEQVDRMLEWLREVSEPPKGLELRAIDGLDTPA
ncbi:MAG: hypothetical protein U0263_32605 [Polyangiaceae bacterium]